AEYFFRRPDTDPFLDEQAEVDRVKNRGQIKGREDNEERRQEKQGGLPVTHTTIRLGHHLPLTSNPLSLAFLRDSSCQASRACLTVSFPENSASTCLLKLSFTKANQGDQAKSTLTAFDASE